jgi:hypothetical protein
MTNRNTAQAVDLLEQHRAAGLLKSFERVEDQEFPSGFYYLVDFGRGDPWKMTRSMVSAFDKGVRAQRLASR